MTVCIPVAANTTTASRVEPVCEVETTVPFVADSGLAESTTGEDDEGDGEGAGRLEKP